jgi:C4-dicarboxylate transporter, DctM subunit
MFLICLAAILLFAVLGAPLFTIFGSSALLLWTADGTDTMTMIIETTRLVQAPALVAIPLFTFSGYMMAESKTPERMVRLNQAVFGWMPGGLAIVSLVACSFFTAFTGASGVTIIALGGLLYPIMQKRGYSENFSLGLVTTGGSLGLLFVPSLPLILYGIVAKVDIDKLFIAGFIPGIVLLLLLSAYSIYIGKSQLQTKIHFSLKEVFRSLKSAICEVFIAVFIVGGIYGGIFTASEAAAICAALVLIVEVVIYRDLSLRKDIPRIIKESMVLVGGIIIILSVALGFTSYLIEARVPDMIFNWITQYISSKWMFLVALNVFLLIVGCLMDIFSALIVVVPLIIPIADNFGVDPIHLGIIFLTNLEIGYMTPPVGLNLFISSYRFDKSILKVYAVAVPFLLILLLGLLLITYIPQLSLFLLDFINV